MEEKGEFELEKVLDDDIVNYDLSFKLILIGDAGTKQTKIKY